MDHNDKLHRIQQAKAVIQTMQFFHRYYLDTYGYTNKPEVRESLEKQEEITNKALAALEGITDIVTAEVIVKDLFAELSITRSAS